MGTTQAHPKSEPLRNRISPAYLHPQAQAGQLLYHRWQLAGPEGENRMQMKRGRSGGGGRTQQFLYSMPPFLSKQSLYCYPTVSQNVQLLVQPETLWGKSQKLLPVGICCGDKKSSCTGLAVTRFTLKTNKPIAYGSFGAHCKILYPVQVQQEVRDAPSIHCHLHTASADRYPGLSSMTIYIHTHTPTHIYVYTYTHPHTYIHIFHLYIYAYPKTTCHPNGTPFRQAGKQWQPQV